MLDPMSQPVILPLYSSLQLQSTLNPNAAEKKRSLAARDYKSHLSWECFGIPQEELENVAWERDV